MNPSSKKFIWFEISVWIFFILLSLSLLLNTYIFLAKGQTTDAVVIDVSPRRAQFGNRSFTYEYINSEGLHITGTDSSVFQYPSENERIKIRYLPEGKKSLLRATDNYVTSGDEILLPSLMTLVSGSFLFLRIRKLRKLKMTLLNT